MAAKFYFPSSSVCLSSELPKPNQVLAVLWHLPSHLVQDTWEWSRAADPENCNSQLVPFWKWRNVWGKGKGGKAAFITHIHSYGSHTWTLSLREIPEVFTSVFYMLLYMVWLSLSINPCVLPSFMMLHYRTITCLKRKHDTEKVEVLRLQVSDTIGYGLLIQACTALSCYQAAPATQPLKANTMEVANVKAGRSCCHFENPSIQNPILLFATSLLWNPKVIFHLLLLLLLPLSPFWSLHSNSTEDLLFSKEVLFSHQTYTNSQAAF